MPGTPCPFCGAYSVRSCEFEGGDDDCPWDDLNNEPDLDPDYLREIRDERSRLEKEDRAMTRPDLTTWALDLCDHVAARSRDPSTQVGAVILRPDKTVASAEN